MLIEYVLYFCFVAIACLSVQKLKAVLREDYKR